MRLFKSFYAKITAVFLVLLIVLGFTIVYISYHSYMQLGREAGQKLNLNLASNMADELEPFVQDSLDLEEVKHAIHYMMVYNPQIEIYLLGSEGDILAYFADPPQKVEAEYVDLEPIRRFLYGTEQAFILGQDPRQKGEKKPFSASTIQLADQTGYLYIILGGEQYESAIEMVKNSYILRTSFITLTGAVLVTGILGLSLFFVLTRRIRSLADTVQRFEQGKLDQRIPVTTDDEIGQLARSFNSMADSLEAYIERIKNNDRMRRELIANISHDLRSPLASIQGYLETIMIKGKDLAEDKRKQYIDTIHKNTQVLSKLVEDLFELSKLEAKQVEIKPEPISITELCQDVALKFKPEAEKNNIDLESSIDPSLPFVKADISLIERVLSNILRNALHYTPVNGKVELTTKRVDGTVRVSIHDTGPGIDEADLPYIFDRFYRGKDKQNRPKGSSGLGLAIAQKIIELHDSEIRVKSEPDDGTVFYFDLPVYTN